MFDDDNKIPSNFHRYRAGMAESGPPTMSTFDSVTYPSSPSVPELGYGYNVVPISTGYEASPNTEMPVLPPPPPPPKPKNWNALVRAEIISEMSENGAPRRIRHRLTMADEENGSGKAVITIGKDIKERKFEVPISVKNGEIKLGKARDIATEKRYDIKSEDIFAAPDSDVLAKELNKTYDKYVHFFSGRVTDKKVEALLKRYPSLNEDEAQTYLADQFEDNKGIIYKAGEMVIDHKKVVIIVAAAVVAVTMIAIAAKANAKNNSEF